MTTLEGAVAVVTGAGRGIGRAIAEELGRGGARVVVNYSRSKGPAEELIEQLMEQGSPQAVPDRGWRLHHRSDAQYQWGHLYVVGRRG